MPAPADSLLTLPPPRLAEAGLLRLAADHYGLDGTLTRLTSERDLNHRLTTPTGQAFVLKLSNPAEPRALTEFQTAALRHAATRAPGLPLPRVIPTRDGRSILPTPHGALRILTWLDGTPLADTRRSPTQSRAIGRALATLTAGLTDFGHPAADHVLLWDIKQTPRLASLLAAMPDPVLQAEASTFIARFAADIAPRLTSLPTQVVHADFNPHNLLTAPDDPTEITGILDFGDMVRTPRICDLAIAASYRIDATDPLAGPADLLDGYNRILPLTPPEIALLFELITARLIATLTITSWRAARYPGNAAYILRNQPSALAGLQAFRAIDPATANARFVEACERTPR